MVVFPSAHTPMYRQDASSSPNITTASTESTESGPLKSQFRVSSTTNVGLGILRKDAHSQMARRSGTRRQWLYRIEHHWHWTKYIFDHIEYHSLPHGTVPRVVSFDAWPSLLSWPTISNATKLLNLIHRYGFNPWKTIFLLCIVVILWSGLLFLGC